MGIFARYITYINLCVKSNEWGSSNLKRFKEDLKNGSDADVEELRVILLTCLKSGVYCAMPFANIIMSSKKLINWKRHPDLVGEIFVCLGQSEKQAKGGSCKNYGDFMVNLVSMLRNNQLLNENVDKFIILLNKALATDENPLQGCTYHFTYYLPWERHTKAVLNFMDKSYDIFKTSTDLRGSCGLAVCIHDTWKHFYMNCQNKQLQAMKYKDHVTQMFLLCKHYGWDVAGSDYQQGAHYLWLVRCLSEYIRSHKDCKEIIQPIFKACKELWECEDEKLRENVADLMVHMDGGKMAELDEEGEVTDKIIERYLSGSEPSLINSLAAMYHVCPEKLNPHLDEIAKNLEDSEDWNIHTTISFFRTVCVEHPEEMTDKSVLYLVLMLKRESLNGTAFSALVPLSEKRPEMLLPHEDAITEMILSKDIVASQGISILLHMALAYPEKAEKILEVLRLVLEKAETSNFKIMPIYHMRTIGQRYPELLMKYETYFRKLKTNNTLKDHISPILDIIEGRSLEGITKDVKVVLQNVRELDDRVTTTEENVSNLGAEGEGGQVLVSLQDELPVGQLQQMEARQPSPAAELMKSEVPEIYSHVSKLLHQKDTNDWKLLASRLGYNMNDMHQLTSEPDPCVSMLQRWFHVNSSSDAVIIVLKHLEDLCGTEAYPVIGLILRQTDVDTTRCQTDNKESPATKSISVHHREEPYKAEIVDELGVLLDGKLDTMKTDLLDTMKVYMDSKFSEMIRTESRRKRPKAKASETSTLPESFV